MTVAAGDLWDRYCRLLCVCEPVGMSVDVSRMRFDDGFLPSMKNRFDAAFDAMAALEAGAVANPDEGRQVGHYWLRAVELAPDARVRHDITGTIEAIRRFASELHAGQIRSQRGKAFRHLLLAGIGGSALGPQMVSKALSTAHDPMQLYCCDNTDPDGFDDTLSRLAGRLDETLVVVTSKSGGTVETRNAMLEVARAYEAAGLKFALHAVAVTSEGSALDLRCEHEGWLARFPMWDWVGGRTSQTSAVGLLPACLQGFDIGALLDGAREMDIATRNREVGANPAALLAAMWFYATGAAGRKDMVVIPYKDRLSLLASYLQQLVMESLGKETDLDGRVVHQGLTVFGNKGSTDQHAYVQQLRDGVDNFFVTFIGVRRDREGPSMLVEPEVTSGDYLLGFLLGTRQALYENGRESISIMLERLDARSVGAIIALFERAVGLYASLINVNAYHQPGVEAGKKAAGSLIELQRAVLGALRGRVGEAMTLEALAAAAGAAERVEDVFHIVEHLAANPDRGVVKRAGATDFAAAYSFRAVTK